MKDSREHILETSLQLFLQKGFKAVTMREIVEKTGFSKGAFYHYFSSKEEVFSEVINQFYLKTMAETFDGLKATTLKEFYNELINRHEQSIEKSYQLTVQVEENERDNLYYVMFDAIRILPDFKNKMRKQNEKEMQAWLKIITKAQQTNEIKSDLPAEDIALLFIYTGDGFALNSITGIIDNRNMDKALKIWETLYLSLMK